MKTNKSQPVDILTKVEHVTRVTSSMSETYYRIRIAEMAFREDGSPYYQSEFFYRTADDDLDQLQTLIKTAEQNTGMTFSNLDVSEVKIQ